VTCHLQPAHPLADAVQIQTMLRQFESGQL
jgi:hypothetical protein